MQPKKEKKPSDKPNTDTQPPPTIGTTNARTSRQIKPQESDVAATERLLSSTSTHSLEVNPNPKSSAMRPTKTKSNMKSIATTSKSKGSVRNTNSIPQRKPGRVTLQTTPSTSKNDRSRSKTTDVVEPIQSTRRPTIYEDSLKFFGALAAPTPSNSQSVLESKRKHPSIRYSTRRSSALSGKSGRSLYSAMSNHRRYSNPFMTTLVKSGGRLRFSTPQHEEEGNKQEPWCVGCKWLFKQCNNCSVYNPICNLMFCLPYIQLFWICTITFGFTVIWVTLYAIWGDEALPGGPIFEFYSLAIAAYFGGWIFACINMPPSIGMFSAGVLFGNLELFQTRSSIATATRAIVVAFILLRTGLNIDASIFKTRRGLISRMAFIPGLSEMLVASMFALFYYKLPWWWALLFGCLVAPLSPLAIIYTLVRLRDNGYGEDKGITSVLLMMYALDNVALVTLFGIFFTITFDVRLSGSTNNRYLSIVIVQSVLTILGSIAAGFIMGVFITFFPHRYDPYCAVWRTILLTGSGFGTVLLTHILSIDGAGYLCTIVMAFTATVGWKALGTLNSENPVNMAFAMIWHVLQPTALGLIGAEVNVFQLQANAMKSAAIVIPFCMIQTRFSMAFLSSSMAGFNLKERLFMSLLSLTKGTPQAALAPMAMDLAFGSHQALFAQQLLHVCILEILITLPLGPLLATYTGPKLLHKHVETDEDSESLSDYDSFMEEDEVPYERQRMRSIVGRINEGNEFMFVSRTSYSSDVV